MMKHSKSILLTVAALLLPLLASAQLTSDDYQRRFNSLVNRVGYDGIGFETLLDAWEKDLPEDPNLYQARFLWCFNNAQQVDYIQLDADTYLGRQPILPYTDSLGRKANFFEDVSYDPDLFAVAEQSIVKAIQLQPDDLTLRLAKVSALMAFERESPDMAVAELSGLLDYTFISKPSWTYSGEAVSQEDFLGLFQEFCFRLFQLKTPVASEAFRSLSEKALKYNPGNALFMDNLGSYYLVFKEDTKTALKYYNKVLKAHPDDLTAIKNCLVIARRKGDVKMEIKYLQSLAQYGATEKERLDAQNRIQALSQTK